jgi:predicted GIY-YIG superfamily endonuclease
MIKLTSKARDTVKQRMRELGRTQIDMGNMLGMTQGAFSQKLNAQYEDQGFDTEQLLKICDNLDLHYEKDLGEQLPYIRDKHYEFFYVLGLTLNERKLSDFGVTDNVCRRFSEHERDYQGYLPTILLKVRSTSKGFCLSMESQLKKVYQSARNNLPKGLGDEVFEVDPDEVIRNTLRMTNVFPELHQVTQYQRNSLVGLVRPDRHKLQ